MTMENAKMRAVAGKAARVALAGALSCGLAASGLAVASFAPASTGTDGGGAGFVQTAQAQSKASKAKAAYEKFLFTSPSSYSFALADVNGDKVPELFVENDQASYAEGYSRVYTYRKGSVKLLMKFSVPPTKLYKKKHVLYYWDMRTGSYWGRYFKLSKGKLVLKAEWRARDVRTSNGGAVIKYSSFKVGGKSVSHKKYKRSVKKLTGAKAVSVTQSMGMKSSFTYHENTSANRAAYL